MRLRVPSLSRQASRISRLKRAVERASARFMAAGLGRALW